MFLKEEKFLYKIVYKTLHLGKANRQESCWKVRSYAGEKATF